MMNFLQSYNEFSKNKGLYLCSNPQTLKLRRKITNLWIETIGYDAYEIQTPVLVPEDALKKSGHVSQFKDQLLKIEGEPLYLRPETATSIFANLKLLRRQLKGNPLKIYTIGKSFRKEATTRTSNLRKTEFEQMELEVLCTQKINFFEQYKPKLDLFFSKLDLPIRYVQIEKGSRPHYSERTIDILCPEMKDLELGCVNYRGSHDLYAFSVKQAEGKQVYQISMGLDRIIQSIIQLNKENNLK